MSYFDTLRSMTNDPELLKACDRAEAEWALDRARETVQSIDRTLARSKKVDKEYRAWLRRPRCWWCGRK